MRGETLRKIRLKTVGLISIHSPHARGDARHKNALVNQLNFNPLPSCEGRLSYKCDLSTFHVFQSTPLMRGETAQRSFEQDFGKISIHSPHARGDPSPDNHQANHVISIHSPHARGDRNDHQGHFQHAYFNPLPSCEGRPACRLRQRLRVCYFNPLPSCEGRQHKLPKNSSNSRQFIQHNSFYMIL